MKTLQEKLNSNYYGYKAISVKLDDIDESNRIVKGYLSSFDTLDADRDIIRKGAFKKSLNERGPKSNGNRKIAHLRNHDWESQIGLFKELEEDSKGLYFVSELGRSTKGEDALRDYQDEILREHSIGFNYIKDKIKLIEGDSELGDYWEVTEVKLWEGSGVTFGANEHTPTLEANKSILESDYLKRLNDEMTLLAKALRNGKGTDGRLENIEMRLLQIQQKYNSLIELKSFDKNTLKEEPKPEIEPAPKEVHKKFYLELLKEK